MAKNVKVYSLSTCSHCIKTKAFLNENDIPFENIDMNENPQAGEEMLEKSGQAGVPVIDIDGKIIVGFDKEAILEALEIKEG
jgi:glutaredoxin-like YruB-family protein